jgi:prevent-host-death family protein
MTQWQLQEAKDRLGEVIDLAQTEGPQIVTRHGLAVAVVVDADEYRRLRAASAEFLIGTGADAELAGGAA